MPPKGRMIYNIPLTLDECAIIIACLRKSEAPTESEVEWALHYLKDQIGMETESPSNVTRRLFLVNPSRLPRPWTLPPKPPPAPPKK
jgi:hypothetical protein